MTPAAVAPARARPVEVKLDPIAKRFVVDVVVNGYLITAVVDGSPSLHQYVARSFEELGTFVDMMLKPEAAGRVQ